MNENAAERNAPLLLIYLICAVFPLPQPVDFLQIISVIFSET